MEQKNDFLGKEPVENLAEPIADFTAVTGGNLI